MVLASIIHVVLRFTAAKIRFSEQKTKIFLSFFEREYLRAVFTAQSYDKFPNPPRLGGEISVCLGMLDIKKSPTARSRAVRPIGYFDVLQDAEQVPVPAVPGSCGSLDY